MEVTQAAFGLFSVFTALVIAAIYWIEPSLKGVYAGWLLASLAGISWPEIFVGLARLVT